MTNFESPRVHVYLWRAFVSVLIVGVAIFQVLPLTNGDVKVTMRDLCLPVAAVTATVTVGNINSIQVKVADKVCHNHRHWLYK